MPRLSSLTVPALLGVLLLGGCAGQYRQDLTPRLPTSWTRLDGEELPVALPADAGATPVSARTRRNGAIFQSYRMVLSNPTTLAGENRIDVDVEYVPTSFLEMLDRPARLFTIPLYTGTTLQTALLREFPDMETELAPMVRQNRYGAYDYAIARGGAGICVLAWQLLDDRKRMLPESIKAIRVEWRYCGRGNEVLPLLRGFERMTLTFDPDILPSGTVANRPPSVRELERALEEEPRLRPGRFRSEERPTPLVPRTPR